MYTPTSVRRLGASPRAHGPTTAVMPARSPRLLWTAILTICAWILAASLSAADPIPGVLDYQGRIDVNGTPFTGSGHFKFALVDAAGSVTYWSNDGTSVAGGEPTADVTVTVSAGLYSIALGT